MASIKEMNRIQEDSNWIYSQNLAQYSGHWLAVLGKEIIAKGKDLKKVINKVKKQDIDEQDPLYIRVPDGTVTG